MVKAEKLFDTFCVRSFSVLGLFFTIFGLLTSSVVGQDVVGCGGFVRTNKNNIDVTRIQVALFNKKNGNLRKSGSTDCAPINGYYFIPVYENGEYVLRPLAPRGWKLEPAEVTLSIDGKNDACSKNIDTNFEFIGFGITGSVVSDGSANGPGGIDVDLMTTDGKTTLQTSTTNEEGHFDFFGVSPGTYVAKISSTHAKKYAFDSDTRTVEVGEDVGICAPFKISGFELSGEIRLPNGNPMSNVLVSIRKEGSTDQHPVSIRSDKDGKFSARLPNGNYLVKVEPDDQSVKLIRQESEVVIAHQDVVIDPFFVQSFSVSGMVRTHAEKGKPISAAKISVTHDGKTVEVVTSDDGSFIVNNVKNSPISAKVTFEGFDFDVVNVDKVDPGAGFPTIVPARYLLTGKVDRDSLPIDTEVRIKFSSSTDAKQPQNGRVLATDRGTYSIYLPSGSYSVAVELSVEQANIGFAPLQHDIVIVDSPVRNINFQPVRANVEGRVICLGNDCAAIQVSIVAAAEAGNLAKTKKMTTGLKGEFKFEGVLPGTYVISLSDVDRRCWSEIRKQISVSADVKDIQFKQTGFSVQVHSIRPATLVLSDEKGNLVEEVSVSKGDNSVCLKSQNFVKLSTKGCEEFDINPAEIDDPANIDPGFRVTLQPTKFQVSGRISSKNPIPDLKLVATSELRKLEIETSKTPTGYSFSFLALPGEDVAFNPKSEEHLFDPESLHVSVDNDCHLDSVFFEATTGFFLRGQVSPPVEDVKIDLVDTKTGISRQTVHTSDQGTYKVGPLPADSTYDVVAVKEGYIFEKASTDAQGNFNAKKLASIVVNVVDGASGAVLSGVVVSISGGVDYRSNTVTKAGGDATFLSLAPGRYFAKPQIKEYEFTPKHELLELVEGQTGQVTFSGKRVAFSIFGKISSLNGEPEAGVVLKAKGVAPEGCVGHSEEATSESGGDFRFRGLQPNCEYILRLQNQKQNIEKLLPDETKVLVGQDDTFLASPIIAMRSFEYTDVTLIVVDAADGVKPPLVKISVTADSGFNFNFQALVGQLVTLPRLAKDDKRYTVTVDTVRGSDPKRIQTPKRAVVYFRADEYYKVVTANLTTFQAPTTNKTIRKISSFVFVLPLVIALIATYIFWDKMPPTVHQNFNKLIGGSAVVASTSDNEEVWDGTMGGARKRTNKKRA